MIRKPDTEHAGPCNLRSRRLDLPVLAGVARDEPAQEEFFELGAPRFSASAFFALQPSPRTMLHLRLARCSTPEGLIAPRSLPEQRRRGAPTAKINRQGSQTTAGGLRPSRAVDEGFILFVHRPRQLVRRSTRHVFESWVGFQPPEVQREALKHYDAYLATARSPSGGTRQPHQADRIARRAFRGRAVESNSHG
jgi:hypothetical protein